MLLVALWILTLGLLVVVVRGPGRWYRQVTLHVRPGTREPTEDGLLMLGWRNVLLLLVVGAVTVGLTRAELRPSEEELVTDTGAAVDLVAPGRLTAGALAAQLRLLTDREVVVDDVTPDSRGLEDADGPSLLQVRWPTLSERFADRRDEEGTHPGVACVSSYPIADPALVPLGPSGTVTEGPCEPEG